MPCTPDTSASEPTSDRHALHDWVLSLPWVVERPYSLGSPGVRIFAVDCAPMGVRRVWLVTGLPRSSGVAVIVNESVADDLDILNLANVLAPMPPNHVLATLCPDAEEREIERVLLEAYSSGLA